MRTCFLSVKVFVAVACFFLLSPVTHSQETVCGSLKSHYGPFDYRTARPDQKELVESYHFTLRVENLIGGKTSTTPGGDLAYTLHAFPNHPRALMALMKFSEKLSRHNVLPEMKYSVPCYFERAERFQPDDAMVKTLFGIYLLRAGKQTDARGKLDAALGLAGNDANINYNLGLAFFDLKEYDKSLEAAHRAYTLNFPLPGLRDKLKRAGKWSEPVAKESVGAEKKQNEDLSDESTK